MHIDHPRQLSAGWVYQRRKSAILTSSQDRLEDIGKARRGSYGEDNIETLGLLRPQRVKPSLR